MKSGQGERNDEETSHRALLAARASYSRLVAYLSVRTGDMSAAEDALSDAFRAALETWPEKGVPDRPEAWLLTAARHRLADLARHGQVHRDAAETLRLLIEETAIPPQEPFPDERLKLLFICAHPAIDPTARTPLMLQTVLGLDAARIASAFLVSPATMSQRLVRAKAKIRDARIAFTVPDLTELPERLDAVLDAIYAAYGTGWDDFSGSDSRGQGLADEAIWLARLSVQLLPTEAEAKGLLALILFCEARKTARRTEQGAYVPLSDQDTELWSREFNDEAKSALAEAAEHQRLGRYQLEAAIQSLHATRIDGDNPNWTSILALYDALIDLTPTIGAQTGRAAAMAETLGPTAGLAALDAIEPARVAAYQPYWAVRGELLLRQGRLDEARSALDRAIGLTEDGAVRAFLKARRQRASSC